MGKLIILSGPSGVGKSTVCDELLKLEGFERVVTCTTRAPRRGEVDGKDYHFLTRREFEEGIRNQRFLEHALVHGHFYGTPRSTVEKGLDAGKYMLLNIDVQGAAQVREAIRRQVRHGELHGASLAGRAISIFLLPPSESELRRRLSSRATDSPSEIGARLRVAEKELDEKDNYDHRVVNGAIDQTVREILAYVGYPAASSPEAAGKVESRTS